MYLLKIRRPLLLATVIILPALSMSSANASVPREYQIKAAILFNFTKFAKWPERVFTEAKQNINICLFSDNPFDDFLQELVKHKTVGKAQRKISIITINQGTMIENTNCQVVFLHRGLGLESNFSASTLVIGEYKTIESDKVHFNMQLNNSQVYLEVNLDNLSQSDIHVSSRLLKLARKKIGSLQ